MRENQLPMDHTSDDEAGEVRPSVVSGDDGAHVPGEQVTHVETRQAGKHLADDSSNSVQITLAHISDVAPTASASPSVVAVDPIELADSFDEDEADDVDDAELDAELEQANDSKLAGWLLAAGVVSVTAFFGGLYTIRNPEWVPNFVARTTQMSEQFSANIKRRAGTAFGGTAVTDTAKARVPTRVPSRSDKSTSGANRTLAPDREETAPRESSRPQTQNGKNTAISNAPNSGSGGGRLLASSPQSKPNQGVTVPVTEMAKQSVKAKTSRSKKGYMVPPPPPTPVSLPPGFGFFGMQPAQQHETQASPAAGENMLQRPNSKAEPHTPAVIDAEKDLNDAVNRSLHTMRQWTR